MRLFLISEEEAIISKNTQLYLFFVPECIRMTAETIPIHAYWLPDTCAYKLLYQGKKLPDWHPLKTETKQSVHDAGISVQGWSIPEFEVAEEDWEDHVIES